MMGWNPFRHEHPTPRADGRLQVVATIKSTGLPDEEILEAPDGTRYRRRLDQTPEPYPIIRRDRVNGRIKNVTLATPTAPLRRVR